MNRGATIHVISDERFASCKEHTMVTTYLASCRVGRSKWLALSDMFPATFSYFKPVQQPFIRGCVLKIRTDST